MDNCEIRRRFVTLILGSRVRANRGESGNILRDIVDVLNPGTFIAKYSLSGNFQIVQRLISINELTNDNYDE